MLITEPVLPIEGKGRNVRFARNVVHLIVASNSNWVVPAGLDERRFCVIDVSDVRAQDSNVDDGVFDVSNRRRLGVSAPECLRMLWEGATALLRAERKLAGNPSSP